MISANGVEYKNLPEQVQYLTERAAEFAVELDTVSASVDSVAGDVAALQTSYTALAEDVRIDKVNINTIFGNLGTIFTDITNIKNGTTHLFENITDSHGNKRFVEGDITMETITGVTQTYGKWSLSGTHLMIVIAGTVLNGTILNNDFANFEVPSFIYNKIKPIYTIWVDRKQYGLYDSNGNAQNANAALRKINNILSIVPISPVTSLTANRSFRIQFDLLIDAS